MRRTALGRRVVLQAAVRFWLLGITCLAIMLVSMPTWAPEDPWRIVAVSPGTPTIETITAELLDRFLVDNRVRIRPDLRHVIAEAVAEQSVRHGIRPRLLLSVILSESSFRTDVVSNKGAVGLMQLMPATAEEIAGQLDLDWEGESRLRDPQINIALGAYYLDHLLGAFDGDLHLALAAYNMGPGNVRSLIARRGPVAAPTPFTSSYAMGVVARLEKAEPPSAQSL